MFNQNVNQENLDVGNDDNIAEDGVLSANDIHAMPDQYFQKNDQPKGKGKWIILGSGIVKHHICNANMFRNGAEYAVYVNNAQEFDGSDAGGTIVTAMTALTHPRFAEVGALVNREFILRGTAYDKGSESHFKIFSGDEGVPPLGQRTAFSLYQIDFILIFNVWCLVFI